MLDPFFGTGTTGAIAKRYGRHFIGIDQDLENKYIPAARKRISEVKDESNDISNLVLEVKPPKFSTKQLIAMKLLIVNEKLFDQHGAEIGSITESGLVNISGQTMSIHKASASILNKSSHNGWSYFYVKRDETMMSIDELRYTAEKITKTKKS